MSQSARELASKLTASSSCPVVFAQASHVQLFVMVVLTSWLLSLPGPTRRKIPYIDLVLIIIIYLSLCFNCLTGYTSASRRASRSVPVNNNKISKINTQDHHTYLGRFSTYTRYWLNNQGRYFRNFSSSAPFFSPFSFSSLLSVFLSEGFVSRTAIN